MVAERRCRLKWEHATIVGLTVLVSLLVASMILLTVYVVDTRRSLEEQRKGLTRVTQEMELILVPEENGVASTVNVTHPTNDTVLVREENSAVNHSNVGFTADLKTYIKCNNEQTIVFDEVISNDGNSYNAETGIFSAPVDGQYMFAVTIMTLRKEILLYMMNNDAIVARILSDGTRAGDGYDTSSRTIIISMKKGDTVYIKFSTTRGGSWEYCVHGDNWSAFSGVLIH